MTRPQRLCWIASLSPASMGIVVGLAVFLPALVVISLLYRGGSNAIHEEVRGNLKRVAKAAALLVDPELHKTFTDPAQESTAEYERAIAPMRAFVESDPQFKYVYTYVVRDGQVYFVLDPTAEGDSDNDGVDDKSHIMELYDEDNLDRMLHTASAHTAEAETELDSDQWGTFLSAYAPIFDKEGSYVACIGVDITADKYAMRLAEMRRSGIIGVAVAFAIALFVAIAGAMFQRRRIEWAIAEERDRTALEEFASSLDSANAQLRFASKRFESLFNLVPVACFTFDHNGTIYEWNRESERLMGVGAHEVVQHTIFETVVSASNHGAFKSMIEAVFMGRQTADFEWTEVSRSGKPFTATVNSFPLYAPNGEVTGGIVACADITDHKQLISQNGHQMAEIQRAYTELSASKNDLTNSNEALSAANEQLKMLASTDGLTGIPNRRTIFEFLERAMSTAVRSGRPLSILMADIDHFKALNDTHGHVAGDAVLRSVASQLGSALRSGDQVGRFGGEEFLVVLPDTDAEEARRVAERIRMGVASTATEGITATISLGASTLTGRLGSENFIDSADRALYEAKRSGRNRVVHSNDLTEGAA